MFTGPQNHYQSLFYNGLLWLCTVQPNGEMLVQCLTQGHMWTVEARMWTNTLTPFFQFRMLKYISKLNLNSWEFACDLYLWPEKSHLCKEKKDKCVRREGRAPNEELTVFIQEKWLWISEFLVQVTRYLVKVTFWSPKKELTLNSKFGGSNVTMGKNH